MSSPFRHSAIPPFRCVRCAQPRLNRSKFNAIVIFHSRIAAARCSPMFTCSRTKPPFACSITMHTAASPPRSVAINNNDRWKKNSHVLRLKPVSMMVHNLITENSIDRTGSEQAANYRYRNILFDAFARKLSIRGPRSGRHRCRSHNNVR